jgi:hypothetical protein
VALSSMSSTLSSLMGALPHSTPHSAPQSSARDALGVPRGDTRTDTPPEHRATDGSRDNAAMLLARASAIGALTYGRRPMMPVPAETDASRTPIGVRGAMLDVRV